MSQPKKTTAARIATAIKAVPLVNCAINARRRLILRQALSLYRKDKFLSAAIGKQLLLFAITLTAFVFSVVNNAQDPSVMVRFGRPLTAFLAVLCPAMYAYFNAKEYARRKERFLRTLEFRTAVRNAR
jgi:hypothetical protein